MSPIAKAYNPGRCEFAFYPLCDGVLSIPSDGGASFCDENHRFCHKNVTCSSEEKLPDLRYSPRRGGIDRFRCRVSTARITVVR